MFPSPSASNQRPAKVMAGSSRLPYYEDLYSTRNEDEEFDRFPEECNESSSEEESKSGALISEYIFSSSIVLSSYIGLLCHWSSSLPLFLKENSNAGHSYTADVHMIAKQVRLFH